MAETKKKKLVARKTKTRSKSLAIRKKSQDKKLVWAGAKKLLGKADNAKEAKEKNMILLASKVLNVSPFGVNILGSLPYINKLGLKQKTKQYNPNSKFIYEWIKTSKDDEDKAICSCKIVDGKGKDITDWIIGECSPASMKMGTLKGYQNHMAQTRARNRAILEAYGERIHEEMMANIEKLSKKQEITTQEAANIGDATVTSVEEVNRTPPFPVSKVHKKNGKDPETLFDVLFNRIKNEEDDNVLYRLMLKIRKRKADKLLSQSAKDKLIEAIKNKLGVSNENL